MPFVLLKVRNIIAIVCLLRCPSTGRFTSTRLYGTGSRDSHRRCRDLRFAEVLRDCTVHLYGIADRYVYRRVVAIVDKHAVGRGRVRIRRLGLHVESAKVADVLSASLS